MTLTFTTGVVFLLCCAYLWRTSDCQPIACRHDCVPHENTVQPLLNQYALYRTYNRNQYPYCKYRNPSRSWRFQIIRPIEDLGNENVRLLYSPGILLGHRYANNMVVKYNVQCPEGRLPYLDYNTFSLQGKDCYGSCMDHVTITCPGCPTSKSCGTEPTNNYFFLHKELFSVKFRTSRTINDIGFMLCVICFISNDMNEPGVGEMKRNVEGNPVELSVNEREVVNMLTNELFHVIPPSNDLDIADITDSEDFQEDDLSHNSRRSAATPYRLISTSIIRLALLYSDSHNPVVKAAAIATVSIATRQSPSRVESVRQSLSQKPC